MRCGLAGELELDDRWSVGGMVLRDDECLLDRDGRFWCQPSDFDADPPHEVRLAAAVANLPPKRLHGLELDSRYDLPRVLAQEHDCD